MILLMKKSIVPNQTAACVATIRPEAQHDFKTSLQLAENERVLIKARLEQCA